LRLQSKLLTLLQDRTYTRVGGHETLRAEVRIIAATNWSLEELVKKGEFRQDLYYRLRVVEIELPPLRERGRDDIIRLINHFVAAAAHRHNCKISSIQPEAMEMLLNYPWPGNVRELQNCLESAVIFSDGVITGSLLPLPRAEATVAAGPPDQAPASTNPFEDQPTASELEARYIRYLLQTFGGNRSACARVLGIGRNTLLRKLKELGIS
jgi:Nif-specific regulatory protein